MLQGDLRQHFAVFLQPSRPVAQSGAAVVAHWRGDSEHETGLMFWVGCCEIKILLTQGGPGQDNRSGFIFTLYSVKIHLKNFRRENNADGKKRKEVLNTETQKEWWHSLKTLNQIKALPVSN